MRYLFSRPGLESIIPFLGGRTLLAFDFDGTLAPIVAHHTGAALPKTTLNLLRRLARQAPVALLSGRGMADLKSRSPLPLLAWIGNHGMEGLPGNRALAARTRRVVAGWHKELADKVRDIPGVVLEDKRYSLTLHYRASSRPVVIGRRLRALVAKLRPKPEILPGKCVLNLLAPGHIDKGEALLALMKRYKFGRAIFVGDDDTDEDVFRLRDPRIFSVRVGVKRGSSAQAYLRDQREANALLGLLLSRD